MEKIKLDDVTHCKLLMTKDSNGVMQCGFGCRADFDFIFTVFSDHVGHCRTAISEDDFSCAAHSRHRQLRRLRSTVYFR